MEARAADWSHCSMARRESFSHRRIRRCVAVTGRSASVRKGVPKEVPGIQTGMAHAEVFKVHMHLRLTWSCRWSSYVEGQESLVPVRVVSPDILLSFGPRGPVTPHRGALFTLRVDCVCYYARDDKFHSGFLSNGPQIVFTVQPRSVTETLEGNLVLYRQRGPRPSHTEV